MEKLLGLVLAFSLAWLWDRGWYYLKIKAKYRIIFFVPLGEEVLKYSISFLFNFFLPLFYFLFGLMEGLFESVIINKKFDLRLILAGAIFHFLLSVFYLLPLLDLINLLLAIGTHMLWNRHILKYSIATNYK